ncbi:bifunctional UDP-N-acetylglucosamine diphosphorylase/glucosamine-1-phosphate N-acetyltransferase GlmU [Clostridium sp. 'deep sea']|uniref:bifunctional UDP-N-acetylglucosamine diphosphorylase/glucosamine-1-phosphate N-acetyltransferase GlmU n=1 Tax=Clostridium sp. 'deep sea' TaxID=2779445 RepID=UPI00189651E5|nr:bifunctional UDP-N-acetylglucosamine diphosphorylase/glucosamine-1-phosphate N-acetyltransferase GlmU [Clostridium sp. 'deep sea']QOR34509.1 bifunctional UDP-N-acetylglucosamine diphosphorylase/glucosamine-1-phosphate N-acetyltransferase GlmU [Clostridium sp. 'deep sea']
MNKDLVAILLTAGKGKRMKSKLIKNLHPLAGKPIINHLIDTVKEINVKDIAVVIGNDAEKVKQNLGEGYNYIYQKELLGTGHALLQANDFIHQHRDCTILVFLADGPLITKESLELLLHKHYTDRASATLMTSIKDKPFGFGRIVRNEDGRVAYTVEEKDANEREKLIKEVWAGICCYEAEDLLESFKGLNNNNAQGEYYMPDTFKYLIKKEKVVSAVKALTDLETLNVNDRVSLAEAEKYLNNNTLTKLMKNGVTIVSPETTFIEPSVKIASDTTILPFTYLTGNSTIGSDCVIGPYTHITNCEIADNAVIERSTLRDSTVHSNVKIGPFAYLRPNTLVKTKGKIGTFVEVKNSTIGKESKVNHLSYVGDTDVGEKVNLGAGAIVVNYDGVNKHRTTVEDNAFVGCNSNLVAPVKIEKGAYVAAGSTVTDNVPSNALAIARSRQINKEDWVSRRKRVKESTNKH